MSKQETTTIQCGLRAALIRPELLEDGFDRFVWGANQARTRLYQLVNLHLVRCLEGEINMPPSMDTNWFAKLTRFVVLDHTSRNKRDMPDEASSAQIFYALGATKIESSSAINQAMNFVGIEYITALLNNIMMHYEQHLNKILKHVMDPDKELSKQERWSRVDALKISKPLDAQLVPFVIGDVASTLQLLSDRKTIIQVLPCFWRMNQYLDRNGLKQFAVLPVAKHFVIHLQKLKKENESDDRRGRLEHRNKCLPVATVTR